MESLGKIFGSNNRVKIMRLFLFNQSDIFDIDDIALRSLVKKTNARKELSMLSKIGFLKKKTFIKKTIKKGKGKNTKQKIIRKQTVGWVLNNKFDLSEPLKTLLIDSELIHEKDLITRIKKTGTIKLLALSGLFVKDNNRKLDILIVGDRLKRTLLEKEISKIESEIGRELSYAIFETEEFNYRIKMYDKLIRDIIENEHKMLVNKILK